MRLLPALLVAALALPAAAQTLFYADLDGTQEVPPNGSTAGGWARVVLNPGNTVTYELRLWGMTATAAHIHDAAAGVNGPVIVPLAGGPTVFTGTSAALSAAQVDDLRNLGLYVNAHSSTFPGGQVRGQLEARPRRFGAFLNGAQEVPPNGVPQKGVGAFEIDLVTLTMAYNLAWTGTTGTAAHIHDAPPGANGGVVFPLLGGPSAWINTLGPVGDVEFNELQAGGYYANIHTAAFPGGAIRGQVLPNGIKYGDTALMPMDLDVTGTPASGGTITVTVAGGNPGGLALVMAALAPGAGLVKGQPFLLDPATLIVSNVLLPLDGAGGISVPFTLPDLGGSLDAYLQVFATSAGPLKASNGVRLPLVDLPF